MVGGGPSKLPVLDDGTTMPDGTKRPNANEALMFWSIIKNMKGKVEIDWAQVAIDANFKNAETAKTRFGQIKRKLGMSDGGSAPATPAKADGDSPGEGRTAGNAATGSGIKKRTSRVASRTNPKTPRRGRTVSKGMLSGAFSGPSSFDDALLQDVKVKTEAADDLKGIKLEAAEMELGDIASYTPTAKGGKRRARAATVFQGYPDNMAISGYEPAAPVEQVDTDATANGAAFGDNAVDEMDVEPADHVDDHVSHGGPWMGFGNGQDPEV